MKKWLSLAALLLVACTSMAQTNFFKEHIDLPLENDTSKLILNIYVKSNTFKDLGRTTDPVQTSLVLKSWRFKPNDSASWEGDTLCTKSDYLSDADSVTKTKYEKANDKKKMLELWQKNCFKSYTKTITIDTLTSQFKEFEELYLQLVKEFFGQIEKEMPEVDDQLKLSARELFIKIVHAYDTRYSETPVAGDLYAYGNVAANDITHLYTDEFGYVRKRFYGRRKLWMKKFSKQPFFESSDTLFGTHIKGDTTHLKFKELPLEIDRIQMEVADGQIINIIITAYCEELDEVVNFTNNFPIPFSTKKNFSRLNATWLYNMEAHRYNKVLRLNLAKVMFYRPSLQLRGYDYSPKDGIYNISFKGAESNTVEKTLYKEETKNLLVGKVYSDFVGFDEKEPNGLVQFEITKTFPFNHNYNSAFNLFSYVEPRLTWSKVGDKERNLPLLTGYTLGSDSLLNSGGEFIGFDTTGSYLYNYTLQNWQYANTSVSTKLNVLSLFLPRVKSFVELNVEGGIFQTGYEIPAILELDSTGSDTVMFISANTFDKRSYFFNGEFRWKFRPDPRIGFDLATHYYRSELFNTPREPEVRLFEEINGTGLREFMAFELFGFWKAENKNDWYFRAMFFHPWRNMPGNITNNFWQVQVGYSFNLINKVNKNK